MGAIIILPPYLLLGGQRGLSLPERFWTALLIGSAYWIAVVLVLARFHFHDVMGLGAGALICTMGALSTARKWRPLQYGRFLIHRCIGVSLDVIEDSEFGIACVGKLLSGLNPVRWARTTGPWSYGRILIWELFLYAAWLRVQDPLTHFSYGFFDPYVHVVWLKELNHGNLLGDGVYPRGYHALLSAVGTFSGITATLLVRFAGAIFGSLLPAALFFLLTECRLPWSGALVGSALIGVCSPYEWIMERQTATLPQEFALVFALAALAFGVRYLRFGQDRDRWVFFCGGFVAWSSHSLVGVFLLIACFSACVDYVSRSQWSTRRLFLLARESLGAALAGNVLLLAGLLLRLPFHQATMEYLTQGGPRLDLRGALSPLGYLIFVLNRDLGGINVILTAAAMLIAPFALLRRRDGFPSAALPSLWSIILFGIGAARVVGGFRTGIPPDRVQIFLSFACCGVAAWLYSLVVEPLLGRWVGKEGVRAGCTALFLTGMTYFMYTPSVEPVHPQYEEAARLPYVLSLSLLPGSWTVVGQSEDYDLVLDNGYHLSLARFLSDYPPYLKKVRFPTAYTFIILEKHPKKLPAEKIPIAYKDVVRERAAEEALLQDWVRIYSFIHADLHVYQDTEDVAIYVLYHPELVGVGSPWNPSRLLD